MAVSHFSPQFQISARAETSHVIATKFQPGGRAEISARAETRHVIGPLMTERAAVTATPSWLRDRTRNSLNKRA